MRKFIAVSVLLPALSSTALAQDVPWIYGEWVEESPELSERRDCSTEEDPGLCAEINKINDELEGVGASVTITQDVYQFTQNGKAQSQRYEVAAAGQDWTILRFFSPDGTTGLIELRKDGHRICVPSRREPNCLVRSP